MLLIIFPFFLSDYFVLREFGSDMFVGHYHVLLCVIIGYLPICMKCEYPYDVFWTLGGI